MYYFSHAMMFCVGVLIETHVVLTPASCVNGERYKFDIFGGSHDFLEDNGLKRVVKNYCVHKGYNTTNRWQSCTPDNIALLVLEKPVSLRILEPGANFLMNRIRYGMSPPVTNLDGSPRAPSCRIYGWGSRRNGYLMPLLVNLFRVDVEVLPNDQCDPIWNSQDKFLCIKQFQCKSPKYGALCPDDVGSVIECDGVVRGMMVSRLVDRPCGVGFLNLDHYYKFLTCGVDDSRDIVDQNVMQFEFTSAQTPPHTVVTVQASVDTEA